MTLASHFYTTDEEKSWDKLVNMIAREKRGGGTYVLQFSQNVFAYTIFVEL